MTSPTLMCFSCEHYKDDRKCDAFEYIPEEIWEGEILHTTPYVGDHGIQFSPIKE